MIFVSDANQVRIRVFPYKCVRKRTELATNFLHKSEKLVFAPLILSLLKEDSAFRMVLSSSSASLKYEGSESMSPDSSWKIISVVSE